jgi:hypothetical protein
MRRFKLCAPINLDRLKTPAWKHQQAELTLHAEDPARALFWQMRTGKSKVVIDTACHLYSEGKIDAVLIFAPNGVHDNWIRRQIPAHGWDNLKIEGLAWKAKLAGPAAKTREAWLAKFKAMLKNREALNIFAFNNESVIRDDVRKLIARVAKANRVLAVWDESADYRTPGSKRTAMMRALARRVVYRRILDGTPLDNKPLHAFAQFELLEKAALGFEKYSDFCQFFASWKPAFRGRGLTVDKYQNLEVLRERLAKYSSVVLREDCDDLPNLINTTREISLSDKQKEVYEDVRKNTIIKSLKGISIGEQSLKIAKLQQVVSGFLYDEYGACHVIPGANPRIEALLDEVEITSGKVIIWAQFKKDIELIRKALKSEKIGFVEYHGDVPEKTRAAALDRFHKDEGLKAFLGQPAAGGRGLEILADKVIWYSHTWAAITRKQASERATKMGGRNVSLVDFIAPGIEHYIRRSVEANIDIADDIAGRGLQEVLKGTGI